MNGTHHTGLNLGIADFCRGDVATENLVHLATSRHAATFTDQDLIYSVSLNHSRSMLWRSRNSFSNS